MALAHTRFKKISRSTRNTVRSLAYRSGTKLQDPASGAFFSYRHKEVARVELLLPEDAPSWICQIQEAIHLNRDQGVQRLCEKVEACEKRKDSQIWREFEFALPRELTDAQNMELGIALLQEQVCSRGIGVLLNFHFDVDPKTGERKPHCHALLLTRRLNESGLSSHKERSWNAKELVHSLREQYEATTNFYLKLNGHAARIDTRSYQAQGLELEGQGKFGSNVREMEQRGFVTRRLASFELSGLRNMYRILKRPEILLESVTRHHATFTWGAVQSILARYVKQEALFERLEMALRASCELVLLKPGQEADGADSVYTTQTLLKAEVALSQTLERLSLDQTHPVASAALEEGLKRFGKDDVGKGAPVLAQLQEAVRHLTLGNQVSCLVGAAGTGKTSVIAKAQRIWEDSGYRVMGLAPTGRAARNLQEAGVFSQTIHRLLGDLASGRQQVSSKTVWVIDEAGMVDTPKFRELFAWAETLGVKVVLFGDSAQLQPVGAGAFFRWATDSLCKAGELARLEMVLRQRTGWQREATQLFASGRTEEALQAYHQAGKLKLVESSRADAREALLSAWSEALDSHPQETLLMLAHSNQDVEVLNQEARHLLQRFGKVSTSECSLAVQQMREDGLGRQEVLHRLRSFSVGDRIRFTRNDQGLGVQNGLLGTVEAVSAQAMRVRVSDPSMGDAGRLVSFSPKLYPYLDYGWALTVHQSQGVTVDRTFVLSSPGFSRNLAYVALSRHREDVQVFGAVCEFETPRKLIASLSKTSEKLGALDYVEPAAAVALQVPPSGALEAALEKLWRQLDAIQFVTIEAWREVRRSFLEKSALPEFLPGIRASLPELKEASRARTLLTGTAHSSEVLSNASLERLYTFLSQHFALPASLQGISAPSPDFLKAFLKDRLEELQASESRGLGASATLLGVLDARSEAHRRGVMEAVLYQKLLQVSPASEVSQKQETSYIPPHKHPWFYEVIDRAHELVTLQKTQQEGLEPFFKAWLASSSSDLQTLAPHATSFLEHVVALHFYTGKPLSVEHLRRISTLMLASGPLPSKAEKMLQEKAISPQEAAAVQRYQTRLEVEQVLAIFHDNAPTFPLVLGAFHPQADRTVETILTQANSDLQRLQDAARQREQTLER